MNRGKVLGVIGLFVGLYVADGAVSAWTLSDFAARPVTALLRDGARVPVAARGSDGAGGEASHTGGSGIPLGYAHDFGLPEGGTVSCSHIGRWMWCGDGWEAERTRALGGV